jgi:hypothetical protein
VLRQADRFLKVKLKEALETENLQEYQPSLFGLWIIFALLSLELIQEIKIKIEFKLWTRLLTYSELNSLSQRRQLTYLNQLVKKKSKYTHLTVKPEPSRSVYAGETSKKAPSIYRKPLWETDVPQGAGTLRDPTLQRQEKIVLEIPLLWWCRCISWSIRGKIDWESKSCKYTQR